MKRIEWMILIGLIAVVLIGLPCMAFGQSGSRHDAIKIRGTAVEKTAPGVGEDNYVLTYDNATDSVYWEVSGAGSADSTAIGDSMITEFNLRGTNAPTDNHVLTWDQATGGFTWVAAAGGGDANKSDIHDSLDTHWATFIANDTVDTYREAIDDSLQANWATFIADNNDTVDTYREAIDDSLQANWAAFIADNNDTVDTYREAIDDSLQANWAAFIADNNDTVDTYREAIDDSLQANWAAFIADNNDTVTVYRAAIHDSLDANWAVFISDDTVDTYREAIDDSLQANWAAFTAAGGDNMGNMTATADLDMAGFGIVDVDSISPASSDLIIRSDAIRLKGLAGTTQGALYMYEPADNGNNFMILAASPDLSATWLLELPPTDTGGAGMALVVSSWGAGEVGTEWGYPAEATNVTDADFTDITVSSGSWTLDANVVDNTAMADDAIGFAEMAHADHGDVTWANGTTAEVEDDSHTHTVTTVTNLSGTNTGDDDVPEAGDFAAGTDFDLNGALNTGSVADNEIDYSAVTLGDFDYQTAWRVFYSNTDGDVTELALGADNTYLMSNGAAVAPTFEAAAGGGDVTSVTAGLNLAGSGEVGPDVIIWLSDTITVDTATIRSALIDTILTYQIATDSITVVDDITVPDNSISDEEINEALVFNWENIHTFDATGGMNFGSASGTTLEIPNGVDPTTDQEGEIAWDADDDALEVYSGDEGESGLIPFYQHAAAQIWNPDGINDTVIIFHADALKFPHGVEIDQYSITTEAASAYTVTFHEYSSGLVWQATQDSLVQASGNYTEDSTPMGDGVLEADDYLKVYLPATDITQLFIQIVYHIKEGS